MKSIVFNMILCGFIENSNTKESIMFDNVVIDSIIEEMSPSDTAHGIISDDVPMDCCIIGPVADNETHSQGIFNDIICNCIVG